MSLEKLITISSDDKDPESKSNSDFFVSLKEKFYTQQIQRIMVKEATVPNCFYNISNGINNGKQNNTLNYKAIDMGLSATITMPEGQYNIDQFMATLIALFAAQGRVVVITQDDITQKLIFNFVIQTTIHESPSTMAPVIGITSDLTCLAGVNTFSMFSPDLSGINEVNIHSSAIAEAHGIDSNTGLISLVERVSLHDIPYGSFGYKQNNDNELATIFYEQPRNLNRLDIRLRDGQGALLNIGTKKMSLVLKVFFA
jgi:hypothetical protein